MSRQVAVRLDDEHCAAGVPARETAMECRHRHPENAGGRSRGQGRGPTFGDVTLIADAARAGPSLVRPRACGDRTTAALPRHQGPRGRGAPRRLPHASGCFTPLPP
jgi:hypothetical protein